MNKFRKWMLKRIAQDVVVQGDHRQRIVEFYKMLVDAARKEFYEDNKLILDSFLEECHRKALGDDSKLIMDEWVTKDVAEAVQRLGFVILDFSMDDLAKVGFSQQEIASDENARDPVFVINLAIALLEHMQERLYWSA
jgi:hypothetical protein